MSTNGNGGAPLPFSMQFEVMAPAGGPMYLQSAEEVDLWNNSVQRYIEDYHLVKTNDLVLLGVIIQNQIEAFRAQRLLNGMAPVLDNNGVPTGQYVQADIDADERDKALKRLTGASDQIQKIEKTLGIDKVTRESGGQVSAANYLDNLKKAAHMRGIYIVGRIERYEAFIKELSTKLRMLHNLDAADRAYHQLTPEGILKWADDEMRALEQYDKDHAREFGKLYLGKL